MSKAILEFKIATEEDEFSQIHRLNYQTFVEEIPQHKENEQGQLIDKFHQQNTYIICVRDKTVVGMLAIRDQRPFSLEQKLTDLNSYLPAYESICEIRLLSVIKPYRNTLVFSGLIKKAMQVCLQRQYDLVIISGTVRQLRLYKHLGFTPFAGLVGTEQALYQPMYITMSKVRELAQSLNVCRDETSLNTDDAPQTNFLPGPVSIDSRVLALYSQKPVSHRRDDFIRDFAQFKQDLCMKLNAQKLQILSGSGTMANDVVAAHLQAVSGTGLILVNGEFGRRLVKHAEAVGLTFDVLETAEGLPIDIDAIEQYLSQHPKTAWVWCVWCETSTGVLNDIAALKQLKSLYGFCLCVDAISAIGSVPVNLSDIDMATAVSGKGLSAVAGLALVFYTDELKRPQYGLPRYFDLSCYEQQQGIPFTISSNSIYALRKAIALESWQTNQQKYQQWYGELKQALSELGLSLVAKANAAPHVMTIQLPAYLNSSHIGDALQQQGYDLSYQSCYLLERNWIQLCFMGQCNRPSNDFMNTLGRLCKQAKKRCSQPVFS